ncbi:SseB family protein [Psychromicrobium lacuslunae]|uniref:SseB protein N-terminal domain-containing protein n=1 Tax=Psychromicrobium lacuslunae TaxID=1618207 RepID=A0A0D4BWC2_9MICC|nr:SseB family protein [Psychromicrobium lacuslunae]AJT40599.1 hypothetical protein UM93_01915 [Psychromicrobium lacuslunae]
MSGSPSRDLPAHIAAALQGAGGAADSAGRAWQGRDLSGEYHQFDGDDGVADPMLSAALTALADGLGDESAVIASLSQARLFVPVIAELTAAATGSHGVAADKESEMALVSLAAPDGRRALPAFSSIERLQNWHPQARPVAVFAPRLALSAVAEEAQLLVIDPAAELTFVVRRPAMWALAQQRQWLPSYQDAELAERIRGIVTTEAAQFGQHSTVPGAAVRLHGVEMMPGSGIRSRLNAGAAGGAIVNGGGGGPELRLVFLLEAGLSEQQLNQLLSRVQGSLAADEVFAERVDSLEISIQSIESEDGSE